jgi:hypothetical protein
VGGAERRCVFLNERLEDAVDVSTNGFAVSGAIRLDG